ncbi:hypothetical protein BDFB_004137, partial [Asbolus verrucosus]
EAGISIREIARWLKRTTTILQCWSRWEEEFWTSKPREDSTLLEQDIVPLGLSDAMRVYEWNRIVFGDES